MMSTHHSSEIDSLNLIEIDWDQTSLTVLATLIECEAVHEMAGFEDLKARLRSDRKIYALVADNAPEEPLIFVQVAFTSGLADNIQTLLDPSQPALPIDQADTALFYSISNTKKWLRGSSLGNALIKRTAAELTEQHRQLVHFATLSPIPGFCKWLDILLAHGGPIISNAEHNMVSESLAGGWQHDAAVVAKLRPLLMRLCAHYLLNEKRGARPLDRVANFHLSNGARIEQINWLADTSDKGMRQSLGLMVNYYYAHSDMDKHYQDFAKYGKVVASAEIRGYL